MVVIYHLQVDGLVRSVSVGSEQVRSQITRDRYVYVILRNRDVNIIWRRSGQSQRMGRCGLEQAWAQAPPWAPIGSGSRSADIFTLFGTVKV